MSNDPYAGWEDLTLIEGDTRVELTHADEGWSGDYNADNPDDAPLVRFYVARKVDGEWQDVDDASYCTAVTLAATVKQRSRMARIIMDSVSGHTSIKKICEELSWLNNDNLGG